MFSKIVACFMILSMSVNGFLPRSVADLSGNTFLHDAVACQSVLFDFLRFSDKTIAEIAVKTADDLSVAAPVAVHFSRSVVSDPWVDVCRALERSNSRIAVLDLASSPQQPDAGVPADGSPAQPLWDNTSADYSLLNNGDRGTVTVRYLAYQWMRASSHLFRSFAAQDSERRVTLDMIAVSMHAALRHVDAAPDLYSGRGAPACIAEHHVTYLPRSGIDAVVSIKGVF